MSDPDSSAPSVVVDHVSKRFVVPQERRDTLKERALHPFKRSGVHSFEALKDVSFAVERGEFFGIVGRNGSGKSTLLKCLGGIYRMDSGQIYVDGRMSTFIELGVGFNPELAARDNVVMNGIMLGLSPREARERFQRVIEFAELEEFVDLKLKNYSSGMHVRLAFSVMSHVDADVLLIDEVLAVGDAAFQQKCFEVFHRLRDEGKTILFVTHDMGAVARFCDRAMLLERGSIDVIGAPDTVGAHYMQRNFEREQTEVPQSDQDSRVGDHNGEIVEAWFEQDGRQTSVLPQGEDCTFCMRMRFHVALEDPISAFLLEDEGHHSLFAISNEDVGTVTGAHVPGDDAIFAVTFRNVFAPGRVYATPWVLHHGGAAIIDRRPRLATAVVTALHRSGGLVDLPATATYERMGERAQA